MDKEVRLNRTLNSLNFNHLRYFWHVAREGNLTKTARLLHISQSALSHQIKELELQIGQSLFRREHRKLKLTEFGDLVLGYADTIFSLGSEMLSVVSTGQASGIQFLSIGSAATLSRNFHEAFLHPILSHPAIRFSLTSASDEELLEKLFRHQLHLVLTNQPVTRFRSKSLNCQEIGAQEVCLIGPPRKSKITSVLDILSELELIIPGNTSSIRTSFDMFCNSQKLNIKVFAEIDDMALLRLLAKHSRRAAIAPAVVVQEELARKELEIYGVIPNVREHFYAITHTTGTLPPLLSGLLNKSLA